MMEEEVVIGKGVSRGDVREKREVGRNNEAARVYRCRPTGLAGQRH